VLQLTKTTLVFPGPRGVAAAAAHPWQESLSLPIFWGSSLSSPPFVGPCRRCCLTSLPTRSTAPTSAACLRPSATQTRCELPPLLWAQHLTSAHLPRGLQSVCWHALGMPSHAPGQATELCTPPGRPPHIFMLHMYATYLWEVALHIYGTWEARRRPVGRPPQLNTLPPAPRPSCSAAAAAEEAGLCV
jgi:hypothetical protein